MPQPLNPPRQLVDRLFSLMVVKVIGSLARWNKNLV